ncbi:MAG: WecB/TagA/CpsF family glycosyltransferase [Planctomycetota bacterium]
MIDYGKHNILGIGVSAIDYDSAVQQIMDAAQQRESMSVTALAVHGVMTGALDREHAFRLNQFDLVCPDGQPVRWALNRLHRRRFGGPTLEDRVYGPELTLRLCRAAAKHDVPIYLFGATDEMLKQFASKLTAQFEGLRIAGMRESAFRQISPAERDALAEEINASGAGICFVGLGCPRQEVFAYEMRDRCHMPLIAVGAAFAFHAGMLEQAPAWMQDRGLEWLYRLTREPGRLWRRYLYLNPAYVGLLTLQKLGLFARCPNQDQPPREELLFG